MGSPEAATMLSPPVVLFDGVCKFCDASVHFIVDRDSAAVVHFAPLQSAYGEAALARLGLAGRRIDSLVLIEHSRGWTRSTAALRLTRYLDGFYPVLGVLLFLPAFLRDFAYDVFAANRYRWFGSLDACRVPTPELRRRFLE